MKEKIIGALASIPLIAAATMSDSCAGGCPYGRINDPFPGLCGRYIDTNGDGICDLSQVVASTTKTTSSTSSSPDQTSTHSTSSASSQSSPDPNSTTSGTVVDPGNTNGSDNASVVPDTSSAGSSGASTGIDGSNYHVLPISILLLAAYLGTYFLFKKGILKPKTHKRLWNLLVTVGYAGVGITGVLLTFMINLGIKAYSQGITFWHVELAILMVIGTLIHLHIYRKPFKRMFKVLFNWKSSPKNPISSKPDKMPQRSK
ncbi:MAG TPA: hypothetical protein VK444_03585 [Methanobacteriaceae archaeon]|nr:hypothetical protein [Methanobacteriaceae archaeon]